MQSEKFTLMQYNISSILGFIDAKDFIVPEIQRPFVWKRSQVRDLIDSLYNGYPTGYIITWKNHDVKTKDGKVAGGRRILIDGQQRITALMAALSGIEVLDQDFKKGRIKIAFNPLTEDKYKRFAVQDVSHIKDSKWIPDISEVFSNNFNHWSFVEEYVSKNPDVSNDQISDSIMRLKDIANRQIGVIELDQALDIDKVTEIFIRINSKGTPLSQSDFVMSKMAADTRYDGNTLRKVVDYFCHLVVKPDFINNMKLDSEFINTDYAGKIAWLANDNEDIYDPNYNDMIRVAFMYSFNRAKISDLVSLLSGRDFETREFKEEIIEDSYNKLKEGIIKFINEYNFKQFVLAIKGAGYKSTKQLTSQMTLDFSYFLYLKLSEEFQPDKVKRYVQKWFVLSTLSQRYVASTESAMSRDIRDITEKGFETFLCENEASVLSETFWNITLPQNLVTTSTNSPVFNTFLAAQTRMQSNSLFMHGTRIEDLINISGDVHHIFPKAYLRKNGIDSKVKYNQIANYTYLDTQVNKVIGERPPKDYFGDVINQCESGVVTLGNIQTINDLKTNLVENAIPEGVENMDINDYEDFLDKRRKCMAEMMKKFYEKL